MLFLLILRLSFSENPMKVQNIPATATPPEKRLYHMMDYNSDQSQFVIFGGSKNINEIFNDVWTFDLNDSIFNYLQPTTDDSPSPRMFSGGFLDSSTNKLYIFGGMSSSGPQNDLWSFDLIEYKWTLEFPTGEIPESRYRFGYTKFYNEAGFLNFLIFGGSLSEGESDDTFIFDVSEKKWSKANTNGTSPPKLNGPSLQYYSGLVYLAGGEVSSASETSIRYFNDTYMLNLTSMEWTWLNLTNKYESRYLTGTAVIDGYLILLYGWLNEIDDAVYNIMKLDLSSPVSWEQVLTTNCSQINSFSTVYVNSSIYLFGGYDVDASNKLTKFESSVCTELSANRDSPSARKFHSMVTINEKVYIFGGENDAEKLDDMWSFDGNDWSSVIPTGDVPTARSRHAYDAQGDMMAIFGGESNSGYLNDLYLYSSTSQEWISIAASNTGPTPRINACLVLGFPSIYIFGGETVSSITNELWVYSVPLNEFSLLYPNSKANLIEPTPVVSPKCSMRSGKFMSIFGTADSDVPETSIFEFNLTSGIWKRLYQPSDPSDITYTRSNAPVVVVKNYVLVIAGEQWSTDPFKSAFAIDLDSSTAISLPELPYYFYSGAYTVTQSKIYLHGGGDTLGSTVRVSIPKLTFFSVDLAEFQFSDLMACFPGSYGESNCTLCPQGSYSSKFSQSICDKCSVGTYNTFLGSNSDIECYPCPAGSYSDVEGATYCLDCPTGSFCPVGSTSFSLSPLVEERGSVQPLAYSPSADIQQKKFLIALIIGLFSVAAMVIFAIFGFFERFLVVMDMFKNEHNYVLNVPMVMKKNKMGGIFFLMFVFASIIIIAIYIIDYTENNILEKKSLLPMILLDKYDDYIVATVGIRLTMISYGGVCSIELITVTLTSIKYSSVDISSEKINDDCYVYVKCYDCYIDFGATVEYYYQEKGSFASSIDLNITSNSSIPGESSFVFINSVADDGYIFRGAVPTEFYLQMTPSLFKSSVNKWHGTETGYHISILSDTVKGSMCTTQEIGYNTDLRVTLSLNKNSFGLYTERYYNVTLILFISSVLGSVFGIVGAFEQAMRLLELRMISLRKKMNSNSRIRKIEDNRDKFKMICEYDKLIPGNISKSTG